MPPPQLDQSVDFLQATLSINRLVTPSNVRADRSLLASVRRYGVLEPVVVTVSETGKDTDPGGFWRVIAGRKRVDAARRAGLNSVPARVMVATYIEQENAVA